MPTLWIDTLPNATVAIGTPQKVSLMTGISVADARLQKMTLLRTIIGLDVARITHDSGEGSEQVFMGICVVTEPAFTAGVASMPDPFVMTDYPTQPWVWRAAYRTYGFAADQPAVFNQRIDLDIRAKRKLDNGLCCLLINNTAFEGTSTVITVSGIIRQLWLMT